MAWLEITIQTESDSIEKTAAALTAAGFEDLVMEDQAEFETFLEENRAYWDYIDEAFQQRLQGLSHIKLYLEDCDTSRRDKLRRLTDQLGLTTTICPLAETNWEESWKDNYSAVEVGNRLVVLPYWLAESYHGDRLPVILDPGLTFGTGAHPSTQMVLEAMEESLTPGGVCLDLGSGSGILSIAALRLGASAAVGVDIDPKAENAARENAAYNGFTAPTFAACTGNVTTDKALMERLAQEKYDLVLVNIVADVIIGLAPILPRFLSEGSTLICSGILDTRYQDVVTALQRAGLTLTAARTKEDWRCVSAKRRLP